MLGRIVADSRLLPILIVIYPALLSWQGGLMSAPFSILQDPEISVLAGRLRDHSAALWEKSLREAPGALMEGVATGLLTRALRGVGADEGSVWLAGDGGQFLLPVWNNGPDAEKFIGSFRLPASAGITGWVFTGGMATCESEVCFNQKQNRELDLQLGVLTWAMLAAPLRVAGETRGVLTAVRLIRLAELSPLTAAPRSDEDFPEGFVPPSSFSINDLAVMESTARILSRLLDHRLQCWALGIEE